MTKILVIGANGKIGGSLFLHLRKLGHQVIGSSYRASQEFISFDLASPDSFPREFEHATHALICAGITSLRRCEEHPDAAFRSNVQGTAAAVQRFWERGIWPILFSSDYVFDGEKGNYIETDATNPLNEYGRQKVALEQKVRAVPGAKYTLFRLSKVFGFSQGGSGLLEEMAQHMKKGEAVRAAADQFFSPLHIGDLHRAVQKIIEAPRQGLYHLCGPETWSRYEIALAVARKLGVARELAKPIVLEDLQEAWIRPKNTGMAPSRWVSETGTSLTPLSVCIEEQL